MTHNKEQEDFNENRLNNKTDFFQGHAATSLAEIIGQIKVYEDARQQLAQTVAAISSIVDGDESAEGKLECIKITLKMGASSLPQALDVDRFSGGFTAKEVKL